ncbi:KilA-N domain-containing protein [Clostridium tagluense]|nr:KilA-N domain-containing protein [Clostridium tagluense]
MRLTDIAKYKNLDSPADIVKNWLRSRSTIEFLGLWEQMNNPDFKLAEFDQFKNEAGANDLTNKGVSITYANEADVLNMALFGKNAKFKSETIG